MTEYPVTFNHNADGSTTIVLPEDTRLANQDLTIGSPIDHVATGIWSYCQAPAKPQSSNNSTLHEEEH